MRQGASVDEMIIARNHLPGSGNQNILHHHLQDEAGTSAASNSMFLNFNDESISKLDPET